MLKMFIRLGERILDFDAYRKEVALIKNYIESDLETLFKLHEFEIMEKNSRQSYDGLSMWLYNQKLDLELSVVLRKRKKEKLEE